MLSAEVGHRPDGAGLARRVVAEHFPSARAAWLGGSVARGDATAASDLDITILLAGAPAPYRQSTILDGWAVELFVHDEGSLAHYRDRDRLRAHPTIQRLVGESLVLLDRDGAGAGLQADCRAEVERGPGP